VKGNGEKKKKEENKEEKKKAKMNPAHHREVT